MIKPLLFMYIVTDSQIKDSRVYQVQELKGGTVLLKLLMYQTKAPGAPRLEQMSLEVKLVSHTSFSYSYFYSLFLGRKTYVLSHQSWAQLQKGLCQKENIFTNVINKWVMDTG